MQLLNLQSSETSSGSSWACPLSHGQVNAKSASVNNTFSAKSALILSIILSLFRNKQRMYFALKSLLQEAQNNLKIFKVRAASVLWHF